MPYIDPESQRISAVLGRALAPDEIEAARNAVPGLHLRAAGAVTRATLPAHAAPLLAPVLRALGASVSRATGDPTPRTPVEWEAVREALTARGELRNAYAEEWPLSYQREALCWASVRPGALLHHPTGSGKTFTAICWILLAQGPALIVTRAASRSQYARQVERFTNVRPFLCKPSNEVRKKDQWQTLGDYFDWCKEKGQRPVVVVGWEALSSWFSRLIDVSERKSRGWTSIVLDESHKGKSKKRWEAVPIPAKDDPAYSTIVRSVIARGGSVNVLKQGDGEIGFIPLKNTAYCASAICKNAKRRLATTATPIPDRVRDLWGQLDLIEPFQWGRYRDFAFRYCDATPGLYGGLDDRGQSNLTELSNRLKWVVHRVSGKVARANLPPKRRETWYIPQSEQVKPSGGWKKAIKAATQAGASAMLEIRLAMAASAKRRAILSRISEHMESGHKVVVFTARRRDCRELAETVGKLKGKAKPNAVWSGHGGDSQESRQKMLAQYIENTGPCVLVGTGHAWGTAIDGLQCTDAAIFALLPYTPGDLDQWEGRFTRHGQDRPVTIYFPIAEGTADEHLASILLEKLPAVDQLAPTDSLDGAAEALAGHEDDINAFAAGVLDCIDDDEW